MMKSEKWKKIGKDVYPRSSFRENLRAEIYEEASKKEFSFFTKFVKQIPFPECRLCFKKSNYIIPSPIADVFEWIFAEIFAFLRRPFLLIPVAAIVFIFLFPLFSSFLFSPVPTIAMVPSTIRSLSGEVFLSHQQIAQKGEEIFEGETVFTQEDGFAEIVFFDGSIIRLDNNTEIEVKKLKENPLFFSAGEVIINLKRGRVWLKTFQLSQSGLGVTLMSPESVIFANHASLDFSRNEGVNIIRVFSQHAQVFSESPLYKKDFRLSFYERVLFSPFDIPQIEGVSLSALEENWVQMNTMKDEEYRKELLTKMTSQMQEKFVMDQVVEKVQDFFQSNPKEEDIEALFLKLNNALLLASAGEKSLSLTSLTKISEQLSNDAEQIAALGSDNIESGLNISEKLLGGNSLPTPQTNAVLKAVSVAREKIHAESEDFQPALKNPSPTPLEEISASLSFSVETNSLKENSLEKIQRKRKKELLKNAAFHFRNQIEAFEFSVSRQNQAKYLLGKIESIPENSDILRAIEFNAPKDVKDLVTEKRRMIEKPIEKKEE